MNPHDSISDLSKIWGTTVMAAQSCILDKVESVSEDVDDESKHLIEQLDLSLSLKTEDIEKCANWCVLQNSSC